MLELGPQQNTAPVGPQKADGSSKRETRLPPYKYRAPVKGSWLHAWRQQQQTQFNDGEDVGVMPAQPAMDSDVLAHLHQLYKEQPMPERSAKQMKPQPNLQQDSVAVVKVRMSQEQEPTSNNKEDSEATEQAEVQPETDNDIAEEATTQLVTNEQTNSVPT